jgi:hypothetical protein
LFSFTLPIAIFIGVTSVFMIFFFTN